MYKLISLIFCFGKLIFNGIRKIQVFFASVSIWCRILGKCDATVCKMDSRNYPTVHKWKGNIHLTSHYMVYLELLSIVRLVEKCTAVLCRTNKLLKSHSGS